MRARLGWRVLDEVERYAAANLPPDWEVIASGHVAMQFAWVRDVQATQMRSFPIALVFVFGLVALFFRSARLAAVAMIPTLIPSIRASVHRTGLAVIMTSFALALGFLTLIASAWQSIASFGFFVAIAIVGALVASLLILPALIFATAPSDRDSRNPTRSEETTRQHQLSDHRPFTPSGPSSRTA